MTRWLILLLCSLMLAVLAWADIEVSTQSSAIKVADMVANRHNKQQAGTFPINFGHSGGWFDESVPGQGMLVDVQPETRSIFMAWFTHDVMDSMKIGDTDHRWITAQGNYDDGVANLTLFLTSGGVFNQSDNVTTTSVGTAQLAFSSCDSATLDYQFDSGPTGQIALQRLLGSSLCESLVPVADVPDEIVKSQLTAISNVNVLPMDEERLLPDQTVIIEDGLIISVSDARSSIIPDNAAIIDGRGRFLGPGLMDMHTHMTFGGTRVRDHSGLLFLLNGVTSILNMGDGLSLQPGLLRDRFVGGDLIGPHLYAGAIAYGPLGGRPANITVLTPQAATAYARMAQQQGYDFIKVYNSLSTEVLGTVQD